MKKKKRQNTIIDKINKKEQKRSLKKRIEKEASVVIEARLKKL